MSNLLEKTNINDLRRRFEEKHLWLHDNPFGDNWDKVLSEYAVLSVRIANYQKSNRNYK